MGQSRQIEKPVVATTTATSHAGDKGICSPLAARCRPHLQAYDARRNRSWTLPRDSRCSRQRASAASSQFLPRLTFSSQSTSCRQTKSRPFRFKRVRGRDRNRTAVRSEKEHRPHDGARLRSLRAPLRRTRESPAARPPSPREVRTSRRPCKTARCAQQTCLLQR